MFINLKTELKWERNYVSEHAAYVFKKLIILSSKVATNYRMSLTHFQSHPTLYPGSWQISKYRLKRIWKSMYSTLYSKSLPVPELCVLENKTYSTQMTFPPISAFYTSHQLTDWLVPWFIAWYILANESYVQTLSLIYQPKKWP